MTELRCPSCTSSIQEGDLFCEQCGARLVEQPGAADGNDRTELDLVVAAGVSDRGRVHRRNEDAFRVEAVAEHRVAAVVCDGISSASAGDIAARNAADAAGQVLVGALRHGSDGASAVLEAIDAAHRAVANVAWTTRIDRDAPSCTFVCALCRDREIAIGSAGDSRAYWISSAETRQLTTDDSWAEEQTAGGSLTRDQAMEDPRAHTITNWIGPDAPNRTPSPLLIRPPKPGRLVLCSDGLWNYLATPAELGELVGRLPDEASAAAVARALTDIALVRGGRDNITVSVVDIASPGGGP